MGFLSASFGLTRYRVLGEADSELWEKIPGLLKKFSFNDIDDVPDEVSFGWVSFDNMLDNKFELSSPFKGEYVCFSLRIDKRKIPPAVFKKYYQMAIQEVLGNEQGDVKYLSRAKKQEIRENLRIKLLSKTLAVPSVTDVVWNFSKGILFLSTTNKSTKEIFVELFQKTFNLPLQLITPYEMGKKLEQKLGIDLDKYQTDIYAV